MKTEDTVLIAGGYGVIGQQAAQIIRQRHLDLPLIKSRAVADVESVRQQGQKGRLVHWSRLVPELTVTNFSESFRFYTEILGFRVVHQRENPNFAYLDQETAQIMIEEYHNKGWLADKPENEPPYGRGINFQIELSDIQPVYDNLLSVQYPLFCDMEENWYDMGATLSGHREFLVQDPDGYLLRFSQYLGEQAKAV